MAVGAAGCLKQLTEDVYDALNTEARSDRNHQFTLNRDGLDFLQVVNDFIWFYSSLSFTAACV